jgi:hypothetical protein
MSPTLSVPVWTSAVATGRGPCPARPRRRADRGPLGVGLELLEVGDEEDHLEEVVEPDPRLRGDRHERHVAAVLLDDDAASESSVFTRSGLASGLSILLSAMTIGTLPPSRG